MRWQLSQFDFRIVSLHVGIKQIEICNVNIQKIYAQPKAAYVLFA